MTAQGGGLRLYQGQKYLLVCHEQKYMLINIQFTNSKTNVRNISQHETFDVTEH